MSAGEFLKPQQKSDFPGINFKDARYPPISKLCKLSAFTRLDSYKNRWNKLLHKKDAYSGLYFKTSKARGNKN